MPGLFKIFQDEDRRVLSLIVIVYLCLNFLYFLNWGFFWMDWSLIRMDPRDLVDAYLKGGQPANALLHGLFQKFHFQPLIYRCAFIACGLVTVVSIYGILQKEILKNRLWSFWATLFFIALPTNAARISIFGFPNILSGTFFYLAFFLVASDSKKKLFRISAILLFSLSFLTAASTFYLYLAFLVSLYIREPHNSNFLRLREFLKNWIEFLILPIGVFGLKYIFFPISKDTFLGHEIFNPTLGMFAETIFSLRITLRRLFFDMNRTDFHIGVLIGLIGWIYFSFIGKKVTVNALSSPQVSKEEFKRACILCFSFLVFSIFPYTVSGRPGVFFGSQWGDLETFLVPFGLAIFFVLILIFAMSSQYLTRRGKAGFLFSIFLPLVFFTLFSAANFKSQIDLLRDAIKQDVISDFMSADIRFRSEFSFVVQDETTNYDMYELQYLDSVYNGLAATIFGDQKRLFINRTKLGNSCFSEPMEKPLVISDCSWISCAGELGAISICKDWSFSPANYILKIQEVLPHPIGALDVLRLVAYKFLDRSHYQAENSKLLNIHLENFLRR
jgi:hypothetical protein